MIPDDSLTQKEFPKDFKKIRFGTKDAATGQWKSSGYINVCRDDTVEACRKMLNEVMDVFTNSSYVSIGADEVADGRFATMAEYAEFEKKHPGEKPYARCPPGFRRHGAQRPDHGEESARRTG